MSTPVRGSTRRRSPHPAPDTDANTASCGEVEGDHQVRRPRRHHQRRRIAWLRRQGWQELSAEAQDFAEFALKWAPYGGPPVEETFLRFGMTNTRFTERLWQLVHDGKISNELSARFAASFPTPGQPQTKSVPKHLRGTAAHQRTSPAATAQ
ncbi:hypothetical protein ACFVKB_45455 [Rhodococcus sp. NPDC127530]|uniref:hypothetical protein n=1 Tax=unclassified Rhodococcus (in: high G+C Gram-positive bacteria) TaxID=192944 RepID=UPI0036262A45